MGINTWNTFVLRVEHPNIVRNSEKSLDMGELTFHVADRSRKPKHMFSFSVANYSLKLQKKHSIKAALHGIRRFTRHYIIRYPIARELVIPSLVNDDNFII